MDGVQSGKKIVSFIKYRCVCMVIPVLEKIWEKSLYRESPPFFNRFKTKYKQKYEDKYLL